MESLLLLLQPAPSVRTGMPKEEEVSCDARGHAGEHPHGDLHRQVIITDGGVRDVAGDVNTQRHGDGPGGDAGPPPLRGGLRVVALLPQEFQLPEAEAERRQDVVGHAVVCGHERHVPRAAAARRSVHRPREAGVDEDRRKDGRAGPSVLGLWALLLVHARAGGRGGAGCDAVSSIASSNGRRDARVSAPAQVLCFALR